MSPHAWRNPLGAFQIVEPAPRPVDVDEDEPCLCGTGFTCLAGHDA